MRLAGTAGGGGQGGAPPPLYQLEPAGCSWGDAEASGWGGAGQITASECAEKILRMKEERVRRFRRGAAPLFFKHVHKASGTAVCSAIEEGAGLAVEGRRYPNGWGTDCVPFEAVAGTHYISEREKGELQQKLKVLSLTDLRGGEEWWGGACWWGHLGIDAQSAVPELLRPGLRFFASEGPMPDSLDLDLGYPMVTALRDPVDRTLSAYKWFKRLGSQFPGINPSICRAYFIEGAAGSVSLEDWLETYPSDWMTRTMLGQRWVQEHAKKAIGASEFEVAKRRLEVYNAVLLSESLEEGMEVLEELFGLSGLSRAISRTSRSGSGANVSRGGRTNAQEELAPEILNKLKQKNVWDQRLYEHAQMLFQSQSALVRSTRTGQAPEA